MLLVGDRVRLVPMLLVGDRVRLVPSSVRPGGSSPVGVIVEIPLSPGRKDARVEWDDGNALVWNALSTLETA